MLASGSSAHTASRSASSYDWSASALGTPSAWPQPLRQAADLMFNTPLPMLLAWGEQPVVLCNDAYGALAGPGFGRAPGGSVPAMLPPPFSAAGDALARARGGEATCVPGVELNFGSGGERFDLYFTPIFSQPAGNGVAGAAGVLCALGAPSALSQAGQEPDTLSILVVEDNLDSQYLVCEMLKAFGYEADGVAHPDDALKHLAAHHYHVLFTDVSLPGMSGVDLARQAISTWPHLKVIFASGYGDMLLRHLDFPYQSLQKPYELDQLQDALGKVSGQLRTGA